METQSIIIRLKLIRGLRTRKDFAEKYHINPATYSKWELSAKTLNPAFLQKVAEEENINIHWLITGEGPQYIDDNFLIQDKSSDYHLHPKIPIIGNISSAESIIKFYPQKKSRETIQFIDDISAVHLSGISDNISLFEIFGNFLSPKFHDHDIIMIDKSISIQKIPINSYGIFSLDNINWIFRRYNIHNGFILLEPLNPEISTIAEKSDNLFFYGAAIHLFRKLH